MAISAVNRAAAHDTSNRTSTAYTTASISFVAGRTYLLAIRGRVASGAPAIGSITGGGNTWNLVQTVNISNITLWLYYAVAASTTSQAISITPDGVTTWSQAGWIVDEIAGATGSPIVQSAQNSETASHSELTVTLGAFGDATKNVAWGVFAHNEDTALTAGSGFSDLGASTEAAENANRIKSIWKTGEDTGVDITSAATTSDVFGIAVEIAANPSITRIESFGGGAADNIGVPLVGTASFASDGERSGEYLLRVNPTTTGSGYANLPLAWAANGLTLGSAPTTVYVGFWFKPSTRPSSNNEVFAQVASIGTTIRLRLSSAGIITVHSTADESVLATGTIALSAGTAYYIEVRAGGGAYEVRVDGATDSSGSLTFGAFTSLLLGKVFDVNGNTVDFYYRDVYVSDDGFLHTGSVRPEVRTLRPNGAGASAGWTNGTGSTYAEVDEVPTDGDTTYIQASATQDNLYSTFAVEDSGSRGVAGTPVAVQGWAWAKTASTSGTSVVSLRVRSAAANADTTAAELTTSYGSIYKILPSNPAGGAWTTDLLDAAEVGMAAGAIVQTQRFSSAHIQVLALVPLPNTGSGAPTLQAFVAAGVGEMPMVGAGAVTLARVTASGSGIGGGLSGTAAVTLQAVVAAGSGAQAIGGSGAVGLQRVTAAGSGGQLFTGTGAATLRALVAAGVGSQAMTGTGAATLRAMLAAGAGAQAMTGTGAATLRAIIAAGAGSHGMSGTAALTLQAIVAAAIGAQILEGAGAMALQPVEAAGFGTGNSAVAGNAAVTLGVFVASGSGLMVPSGVGAAGLRPVVASGAGGQLFTGAGAVNLQTVIAAGVASQLFTGAGAVTLRPLVAAGSAWLAPIGVGAVVLQAIRAAGVGSLPLAPDVFLDALWQPVVALDGAWGPVVWLDGRWQPVVALDAGWWPAMERLARWGTTVELDARWD